MHGGRDWRLVSVVVVISMLAACASSSKAGVGKFDGLRDSPVVEGAYAYPTEPAQPVIVGEEDYYAIHRAIAQRMAERGFEYHKGPYRGDIGRRYGVTDPDVAAVWGFRDPAYSGRQHERPADPPPKHSELSPEEKAWSEALLGTSESEVVIKDDSGRVVERYNADGCSAKGRLSVNPQYFEQRVLHQILLNIHSRASRE